jgi:hypothetical protein
MSIPVEETKKKIPDLDAELQVRKRNVACTSHTFEVPALLFHYFLYAGQ